MFNIDTITVIGTPLLKPVTHDVKKVDEKNWL